MRTEQNIKDRYTITAGVTAYNANFPLYVDTDVAVYLSHDDGVTETLLTNGTHYTVTIAQDKQSGTVILKPAAGAAAGDILFLMSNLPYKQELDLNNVTTIDTNATETQLDRDCQQRQQLAYLVNRAALAPITSGKTGAEVFDDLKGEILAAKTAAESARDSASEYADTAAGAAGAATGFANDAAASAAAAQATLDQVKVETIGKIDNVMARGMFQCEGIDPDVGYESIYIPDSYKVGTHSLMLFDNDGNLLTPKTINPTTYDYDEVGSTAEASHFIKMYGTTSGEKYQYEIIGISAASLVDDDTIKWDEENGISVDAEAVLGDVDDLIEEKVEEILGEEIDIKTYQKINTRDWAATFNYAKGAVVTGSDGNLYVALQPSGPSTTPVNPVTEMAGQWEQLPVDLQPINAKNYGAKGDGETDDTAALNAAMTAAAGKTLYIPAGTYLTTTGLRIPSNTQVFGAGKFQTIIKLANTAASYLSAITNEQNTWNKHEDAVCRDNTGNVNIVLRDIGADGNGLRSVTGYSGCAIQFCNVQNLTIEDVYAVRGRLHCLDVASASYSTADIDDPDGWYYGASSNVVIINPVCVDSCNDDGLTTHFSHDIFIYNPLVYRTTAVTNDNTHGIEIDDGSYRVQVRGGYVSGYNSGIQIKAHSSQKYAPHDIVVDGLTLEGNAYNIQIAHGWTNEEREGYHPAGTQPLRNVSLKNVTSKNPVANSYVTEARHMDVGDTQQSTFSGIRLIGDGVTPNYGIRIRNKAKDCVYESIMLENVAKYDAAMQFIEIDSSTEGTVFKNVTSINCGDTALFYPQGSVVIDGVTATKSASVNQTPLIYFGTAYIQNSKYVVRNVWSYDGYDRIVGEITSGSYQPNQFKLTQDKPCEVELATRPKVLVTNAITASNRKPQATATATISDGAVTAITVSNAGFGYATPPLVKIEAPASGTTATATATINANGNVSGFTITNGGSGYSSAPSVTIEESIRNVPLALAYQAANENTTDTDGTGLSFWYRNRTDDVFEVARIFSSKTSGTDSDTGHELVFYTRDNSDFGHAATKRWRVTAAGNLMPCTTNKYQIGHANFLPTEIFAATGTINTSDVRLKTSIDTIPDAVLDAWGEVQWREFQFLDAVEKKGQSARLHTGLLAQVIDSTFKEHGLDACRYGLLCHDAWEEIRDEDGNVTQEAGDIWSIRYEEALAVEAAYQRRRAARAEARLADLERRVAALETSKEV